MPTGEMHSYSNTLPQKRVVTDKILLTDPHEIVAIATLGLNNESNFMFVDTPGAKYEWLQDTYSPTADAVDTTALTSDTTLTSMTVDNGAYFQAGDVILVDSEYMWVSAVTGEVLTVTRNFGGTQATHADNATVYVIGRNRLEGAAAGDGHSTEVTSGYNYSAILQKSVEVTRSNRLLNRYGVGDIVERQISKIMDENVRLLNKMAYHGQRKVGSSSTPRGFGGLETFITTNPTNASSAALTRKMLEDEVQQCWDNGGNPDTIICGAWAKRKISSFYEAPIRTARTEKTGGSEINRIETTMGINLDVVVDRDCPTDTVYILQKDLVGYITIDPFFYEELAKTKDTAAYGQLVGEYGFVVADEKNHSYIYGISTSS